MSSTPTRWVSPSTFDFQRELLQLPQQPLLAAPHLGDERVRGGGVERDPHARGLLARPLSQLPRLDRRLGDHLPARVLDRVVDRHGRLRAALLAREQRDRRVGRHLRHCRGEVLLDLPLLPALDAVDDDHAAADRERHRAQRQRHTGGGAGLAVEHFDAGRVPLLLGQRLQPRAPLGDRAVVVAVDQVRGLQLCHQRPSVCGPTDELALVAHSSS